MNRQERRASQRIHRKEVGKALSLNDWGEWEDITFMAIMKLFDRPGKHRILSYDKNNIYSAQVLKVDSGKLLGIRRHDQSTDIPWSHKQRIKNEIMGPESQGIEIFPPNDELIDGANMFWVWFPDNKLSGFELGPALRGVYSN